MAVTALLLSSWARRTLLWYSEPWRLQHVQHDITCSVLWFIDLEQPVTLCTIHIHLKHIPKRNILRFQSAFIYMLLCRLWGDWTGDQMVIFWLLPKFDLGTDSMNPFNVCYRFQEQFSLNAISNNYRRPVIGFADDVAAIGRREVQVGLVSGYVFPVHVFMPCINSPVMWDVLTNRVICSRILCG